MSGAGRRISNVSFKRRFRATAALMVFIRAAGLFGEPDINFTWLPSAAYAGPLAKVHCHGSCCIYRVATGSLSCGLTLPRIFLLYRVDSRIQAYSTKNRSVLRLG